jgi:preprotein translocase subunit SecB
MVDKKDAAIAGDNAANNSEFGIDRLYLKDCSFEAPGAPAVFLADYKPNIKVDLQTKQAKLDDEHYDVVVLVTVTAEQDGKTVFLSEVHQGGIFTLKHIPEQDMPHILAVACPNILFPYAREVCSDLIVRGGFPPVYLAPVNFEALLMEKVKTMQTEAANEESAAETTKQ